MICLGGVRVYVQNVSTDTSKESGCVLREVGRGRKGSHTGPSRARELYCYMYIIYFYWYYRQYLLHAKRGAMVLRSMGASTVPSLWLLAFAGRRGAKAEAGGGRGGGGR
jgi:uncharacterized membrane protein YgcG